MLERFELYAEAMMNVWTATELTAATFDEAASLSVL
jgi:hypothetical protein